LPAESDDLTTWEQLLKEDIQSELDSMTDHHEEQTVELLISRILCEARNIHSFSALIRFYSVADDDNTISLVASHRNNRKQVRLSFTFGTSHIGLDMVNKHHQVLSSTFHRNVNVSEFIHWLIAE
jgi:hypothetical protein